MSIAIDSQLPTGEKIRLHRLRRAWSQEDLAEKAGIQLTTVKEVEAGRRNPQFRTIRKIAAVFKVDPGELVSLHCTQRALNGSIEDQNFALPATLRSALASHTAGEVQLFAVAEQESARLATQIARIALMMNRREFMQATAALLALAPERQDTLRSIQYGLEGRKVGGEIAEWARDQVATLSRLDDLMGGKPLYAVARSNVSLLQNLLHMRAVSGGAEGELRLALAHTASQAGWFAQDAELHDLAEAHFRFGVEMARSADDSDFAAYCIMRLASQAIARGNPAQCLSQLESAETEAGAESSLKSFILNFAVEAEGMLGSYKAASLTLAKADAFYDKRQADRVPKWLYWMRRPSLTGKTPRAFLSHDPHFAAKLAEDALAHTSEEFARDRLTLLVELAKAKRALGEIDEALGKAGEVLHAVRRIAMPRVEKQLSEFHARLPDDPIARPFKECFREYQRSRIAA